MTFQNVLIIYKSIPYLLCKGVVHQKYIKVH